MAAPYLRNNPPSPHDRDFNAGILYWPRFRPGPNHRLITFAGAVTVVGIALWFVVGSELLKVYLLYPGISVALDFHLWIKKYQQGRIRKPPSLFLYAPVTTIWVFLYVLPVHAYQSGGLAAWTIYLVFVATWAALAFGKRVRRHYIAYLLEHHHLSAVGREQWRAALKKSELAVDCRPASNLTADQRIQFLKYKQCFLAEHGPNCVLVMAILTPLVVFGLAHNGFLSFTAAHHFQTLWITAAAFFVPMSAIAFNVLNGLLDCPLFPITHTYRAVLNFLYSASDVDERDLSPWSARSVFGSSKDREQLLFWTLFIIGAGLIPAAVVGPLLNNSPILLNTDYAYYSWFPNPDPSYPIHGLYAVMPTLSLHSLEWLLVVIGSVLVPPLFLMTTLTVVFGPGFHAGNRLFEDADALEHEELPDYEYSELSQ